MKKQPDKGKITALYERLSHDDERAGESVSIENQKRILEDYAQKNGFTNIRHFTDDGVRGTTFKRPGLDAMLEEIRAGNVATVIIKDQSRIGRDVVEVGLLKRTFDEYHVRFIAANDNLDTANGFDIMSIFRDVINEWYVADTSRKIKTVFKSRMEKGLRCSGSVSYGYLASKENKGEWVIDEEAAAVVRRIFHSVVAGESIASIARALRAEKIPIPSEHWKRIGAPVRAAKYTDPYAWSTTTISYILKRPEYTGRKVLGKTVCENYKTKSTRKTAPEEQYIFDGEIPAIVDEETWNTVQRLMGTKRRAPKRQTTPNRLTGLLYCADCGAKLTHRSSLVQGKYLDDAFVCSSYRQLTRDCTMHYIPTAKMEAAILAAIQRVSWYVRHNEAEFIERVRKATDQHQENAVKEYRQKVSKAQRRYKELDGLVKKLYEGNATGKIPDKHFTRLLAEYDEEQTGLEAAIAQWQEAIESWNADRLKTDKFIELVSRYTDFSELTTPMLNEFIEKVVVHEGEGRGNSRRQRIDIYLNFIGAFEVPAHIVTPMEAEEQRRQQEEQAANVRRYPDGWGEAHPLTGLMYCADCGGKMYVHRVNNGKRDPQFTCSQYSKIPCGTLCGTQHRIRAEAVLTLITDMLRAIAEYSKNDRAEFIRTVQETQAAQQTADISKKRKRLAAAQKRAGELERLICKIYEDNALGKLPDARYEALDAQYAKEQEALNAEITELEKAVTGYEQSRKSAEKFIALIDKYENFDTLTNTMLNEFVEKILVHERARKGSQDTTQEVEIYFNFVGRYIPPALQPVPLTPEEQEELRKKEERKDRLHQNYLRRKANGKQKEWEERYNAKRKAQVEAAKAAIRAEDMAKGIFIPVSQLPRQEPCKSTISASAAV